MKFFYLIAGGLAAFRLSLLISKEDGPAYIFRKIRHLPPRNSSTKEGLSCAWCMSIWTGALMALYFWLAGIIANLVLLHGFYDIILRDFGLFLGAIALGRLSHKHAR